MKTALSTPRPTIAIALILGVFLILSACGSTTELPEDNDTNLQGTWLLETIDDEDATDLEYSITFYDQTFLKEFECTYEGIYWTDGNEIEVEFSYANGSACADQAQDRETYSYSIENTTLNIQEDDTVYIFEKEE